jgi:predicted transcriptional regulator
VRTSRPYRSKVEVLRDFLRAAEEPSPKTRIIGAANLNPVSFRKYLRLCTEHDLIMAVSGGYVATPRATTLLRAIDGLMVKTSELELALRALELDALERRAPNGAEGNPFRQLLREAWNEIALGATSSPNGRRPQLHLVAVGAPVGSEERGRSSSGAASELLEATMRSSDRPPSSKTTGTDRRARSPGSRSRSKR